jgi:tetratricopeptide (TPR) repeat protein
MRKLIPIIIFCSASMTSIAQDYYEQFQKLYKQNDTTKLKKLLADWEKSNPNDPEFYTSALNYYFANSRREILSIENDQPKKESIQLTDSTGAVAGYLTTKFGYDHEKLKTVINYANKAIQKFPDRLDIRFGKCFVLGEIGDYENFTLEIIKTVEYSVTNKNNWLWMQNKEVDDPEDFMLSSVYEYLTQLYNTEEDALLENMKRIGDATIRLYPKKVEILSITSVAHLLTKSYDTAIVYLKQAETINPKDYIVLNNIAQAYKMNGDKENAIKYYELTEKYGDDQAKQQARKNVKELKKN